jgi:hypothetical protein
VEVLTSSHELVATFTRGRLGRPCASSTLCLPISLHRHYFGLFLPDSCTYMLTSFGFGEGRFYLLVLYTATTVIILTELHCFHLFLHLWSRGKKPERRSPPLTIVLCQDRHQTTLACYIHVSSIQGHSISFSFLKKQTHSTWQAVSYPTDPGGFYLVGFTSHVFCK